MLGTYPNLKIFICSQTYRFFLDNDGNYIDDSDTKTNTNNVKLTDFPTLVFIKNDVIMYHFSGTKSARKIKELIETLKF